MKGSKTHTFHLILIGFELFFKFLKTLFQVHIHKIQFKSTNNRFDDSPAKLT